MAGRQSDLPPLPVEATTPPPDAGNVLPDARAEGAFVELRQQLHALDYRQPLGLETAPLVRRLLDDLLLTTNEYETLRLGKEGVERQLSQAVNDLRPLETENARLVRENNEVSDAGGVWGEGKEAAELGARNAVCVLPLRSCTGSSFSVLTEQTQHRRHTQWTAVVWSSRWRS